MNEAIIKNHNERVKPEDWIYHLGDFCFKNSPGGKDGEGAVHRASYYLDKLNGNFVFVKGNHDRNNSLKTPIEHIVISYGGHKIKLVHDPKFASPRYKFNFCGHVHQKWFARSLGENSYVINVGVDVNDFRPATYEELMKKFHKHKEIIRPLKRM